MSTFTLHPQLEADTHPIAALATSELLLMNDSQYPWLILVPRVAQARELHLLHDDTRMQVLAEVQSATSTLQTVAKPHKVNIAALGNQVEQLHIHIIARFTNDPAWPAPVWGHSKPIPYTNTAAAELIASLNKLLVG